ncbi:cytochrome C oxidase subunit IV family protein [Luteolibacter sp. AS25]|uniref:cytochrome C oxidase subunit IV family protein n=1 Tax=Luteolibacter sp. AS25 TaxID=3135776 RepID=UPI00398A6D72
MANSVEEIQKAKKTYILVFLALLVGTVLTVLVADPPSFLYWLDVGKHGFDPWDAVVGLCIATTKATLVALIFMHLNHEKKSIYWIFFGSFFFCACMAGLIALAKSSPIFDTFFYH